MAQLGDFTPEGRAAFDAALNKAAIDYVHEVGYGGSVEALGKKMAFSQGANTWSSSGNNELEAAFHDGLAWAEQREMDRGIEESDDGSQG